MALTSREFQYLCIGCFLVTPACAIITSSGTIEINTAVDITCINQPYTGTHIWTFNTAEVLICGPSNCMANASNPTRFSFVNDTGSGVFVFTINPVTRSDDESIIGCHNGSVEDTLKLEVRDSDGKQRKHNYDWIIGVSVTAVVVIIGVLILCCFCCPHIVLKLKKSEWEVRRLLGTTLITTLHLRPCHCREYFFLKYRRKPFERDNDTTWNSQKFKDNESQAQLDPNADYEVKVCIKLFCIEFSRTDICTVKRGVLDPPKNFQFNENINNDEMPYVSWEPGINGGCDQTFFLQFEKILIKTHNQTHTVRENFHHQEITNTTAAQLNKPKIVEGHSEILDVESDKRFAIRSHYATTTIRMQIEGLEPSSTYEIKLYGKHEYRESEVKKLHADIHDKPSPPKEFQFNQNISSDTFPNVSWVPGYNGGCYQTFILQFEKQLPETEIKTLNQAEGITNTTAAELNKPKIVERHAKILDVESDKKFAIPSHNVTTTIRMQIKGLEPSSLYEIKLYGKNKYGKSEVKTLHAKTHGKPDPPIQFEFYENINNDEKPYVSWEPGFNGGCDQTFILRFEKIFNKTHNQTDTARDKPMPIEFVEGHPKILNVESNHIFSITSHKETEEIRFLIKGREPSSTYKIMLYSENAYGQSKVMTLHADGADGSSLRLGHTNQPKCDNQLQRHGLSVEESTHFNLLSSWNTRKSYDLIY